MNEPLQMIELVQRTLVEQAIQFGPKLLVAALILVPGLFAIMAMQNMGVQMGIRPWVKVQDFGSVSSDIMQAVLEAFRQRGIHMPFPQREVRLIGPP